MVEFDFEVSFYFINSSFVYALRTGGLGSEQQRWQLSPYTQDQNAETWQQDMEFAASFNAWNGRSRGVVRVDGVRESKTKKPVTHPPHHTRACTPTSLLVNSMTMMECTNPLPLPFPSPIFP